MTFNDLPDEVKLNIFSFGSAGDVARWRLVSKDWKRLAEDPAWWQKDKALVDILIGLQVEMGAYGQVIDSGLKPRITNIFRQTNAMVFSDSVYKQVMDVLRPSIIAKANVLNINPLLAPKAVKRAFKNIGIKISQLALVTEQAVMLKEYPSKT